MEHIKKAIEGSCFYICKDTDGDFMTIDLPLTQSSYKYKIYDRLNKSLESFAYHVVDITRTMDVFEIYRSLQPEEDEDFVDSQDIWRDVEHLFESFVSLSEKVIPIIKKDFEIRRKGDSYIEYINGFDEYVKKTLLKLK